MSRFLVLIKPDGVRRGLVGTIVHNFESKGYDIRNLDVRVATEELLREHYAEHADKPFFPGIVEFMTSGKVIAIEFYGDVRLARLIIGATNPAEADPGSIRGKWGNHTRQNIIHCSDSEESGEREANLWFP